MTAASNGGRKPSPSRVASDARDAAHLAAAVSYVAHFRKGPFESYTIPVDDLGLAREVARALEQRHGKYGRRAIVYAISAAGSRCPVPDTYRQCGT